jgi:hypothetical protein
VELRSLRLSLDQTEHPIAVDGSEPESERVRPLRVAGARFGHYTSAIKHLDPPQLFESRPSYRLLGGSAAAGRLDFGLAAYFDKRPNYGSDVGGYRSMPRCGCAPKAPRIGPPEWTLSIPSTTERGAYGLRRRAVDNQPSWKLSIRPIPFTEV